MDPQYHLIRLPHSKTGRLTDRTESVRDYEWVGDKLRVAFEGGVKTYTYNMANVAVSTGTPEPVDDAARVFVSGEMWVTATAITRFDDHTRVTCLRSGGNLAHYLHLTSEVEVVQNAGSHGQAPAILDYWRAIAQSLPAEDPTRRAVDALRFVHPESALAAYLDAAPLPRLEAPTAAIYPFSSNISQRNAVDMALSHQMSVIEGPPGTGKTQTILNVIASAVAAGDLRVAVVSSSNAAVDNVREKLDRLGVGYIAASLGRKENQRAFLAGQAARIASVNNAMAQPEPGEPASPETMESLTARLQQAPQDDRHRARLESEIAAYRVEHRHSLRHVEGRELPTLDSLPLLRKTPEKILDYVAETSLDTTSPGLLTRVRRYLRYGRTRDIDPADLDVVLRLHDTYYRRRIDELESELAAVRARLERAGLAQLVIDHTAASVTHLHRALRERYGRKARPTYVDDDWRTDRCFLNDYPVVLSTCHSLSRNLPEGHLVDLLIIDEASQVNLLIAAAAMACAKRVVVVGDTRQLPHIPGSIPDGVTPPHPAFDHEQHSLLSSLHALYGEALPSTMLIEHYRCAPEIIGYCNRSFYDGRLINFTSPKAGTTSMHLWTTEDGNHMRALAGGRGISNQREIDVIRQEVVERMGLVGRQVGYITPYRLQADKMTRALVEDDESESDMVDVSVPPETSSPGHQADTVHRFQGRECDVVVMSSVVDDSWRGRYALGYADDARLINVAVSRAISTFVLVTHHRQHPASRNLADLIDYIGYHDPDAVHASAVVSIFDLLYRDYSARLEPFAGRVRRESRFPSEDLARTLIQDILATEEHDRYRGLAVARQYRLAHLFTDTGSFTAEQQRFIRTTSSVDFLIYRSVGLRPVLAIEVDGTAFHEGNPAQQARDRLKDSIFAAAGLPLLRLPTDGSGEVARIPAALDAALKRSSAIVLPDTATNQTRSRPGVRSSRTSVIGHATD